jgi:ribosomal 50S subunit-associated protein YjgA (DUF615 family)
MAKKKQGFQWHRDQQEAKVEDRPSRRDLKQEENERKLLVKALLAVGPTGWVALPMSDALRDGLDELRRLHSKGKVRGGLRRQVLRVAALLRDEDVQAITDAMGIS